MFGTTTVLQIGGADWQAERTIPEGLTWTYKTCDDIIAHVQSAHETIAQMQAQAKETGVPVPPKMLKKPKIDVMLFLDYHPQLPLDELITWVQDYRIFIDPTVAQQLPEEAQRLLYQRKMAITTELNSPDVRDYWIDRFHHDYYARPYGQRISNDNIIVNSNYSGALSYKGSDAVILSADFGAEFSEVATYRRFPYTDPDRGLDIWLEYQKSDDVEIEVRMYTMPSGKADAVPRIETFHESQLAEYIVVPPSPHTTISVLSIYAKGKGELRISNLHMRHSRRGAGDFIPGGKRYVDSKRQEFQYYFSPGNLKPPFNIYFSGYRTQEGFEGMFMMERMEHPYLLICDSRLEGGCFYIGDETYEQALVDTIDEHRKLLGFERSDLILSGLSMGTYGALYYGAKLSPHAIIVGKPIINLGDIALNAKLVRPDDFHTSLDIVQFPQGSSFDPEWFETINQRCHQALQEADLSNTTLALAYMLHDDYDRRTFDQLVEELGSKNVHIIGKGYPGRHNDATGLINAWFLRQYYRIMREDFGSSVGEHDE